ncbi:MAG TPA: hypothetical protein VMZ50_08670, partial [Phycisphaerae bacterium]|nr:hypothetical protein [Phycisphaerae bacterium]
AVAGMCFEFMRVFDPVRQCNAADRVVLGGGASNGWYFRSLLAGLFAPLPVSRVAADDPAGPRGAVYAFSCKAARARTETVPPPHRTLRIRIAEQYERYCRVCEALSRGLPDGGGVVLGGRRRRKPR